MFSLMDKKQQEKKVSLVIITSDFVFNFRRIMMMEKVGKPSQKRQEYSWSGGKKV